MAKYTNFRISDEIGKQVKHLAEWLPLSANRICELAIRDVIKMINNPDAREIPEIVVIADSLAHPRAKLAPRKKPIKFADSAAVDNKERKPNGGTAA